MFLKGRGGSLGTNTASQGRLFKNTLPLGSFKTQIYISSVGMSAHSRMSKAGTKPLYIVFWTIRLLFVVQL